MAKDEEEKVSGTKSKLQSFSFMDNQRTGSMAQQSDINSMQNPMQLEKPQKASAGDLPVPTLKTGQSCQDDMISPKKDPVKEINKIKGTSDAIRVPSSVKMDAMAFGDDDQSENKDIVGSLVPPAEDVDIDLEDMDKIDSFLADSEGGNLGMSGSSKNFGKNEKKDPMEVVHQIC